MIFPALEDMILPAFEAVRPTENLTVAEAGERYHIVRSPGSHAGPYSNAKTPYMREPQEMLTSLDHTGMIFVGPARTGKSVTALNWLAHTSIVDPTDMMYVNMTQASARDWSMGDLAKMLRDSPEVRSRLRPGRQNDNVHDKKFTSGMRLLIKWPTISELSGKTSPRNWIFDYDRIPDDIDGEGNAYDLLKKRAQTFGRFGMTVAESSPGREVENAKWIPQSLHEAPPTKGILELYNRGDRRRWYWKCPHCAETFEPSFARLQWPKSDDITESAEAVVMVCPANGCIMEQTDKIELNLNGRWVRDGMIWLPSGEIVDRPGMRGTRSEIASFWLKGPAAAYQNWPSLVTNFLRAEKAFESSGDEEPLKTTTNVDQGDPYTPKSRQAERLPEDLKNKAEDWGSTAENPTVPPGVRFLIATVDVQARAFVVQVHGFADSGDIVIIDAFKVRKSARVDEDGDKLPIDPAAYAEDWDALETQVMEKTYALGDGSGRRMQIRLSGSDSGGREGVTFNAYEFWKRLRKKEGGPHRRFALMKGNPSLNAPRAFVSWPDTNRKDKTSNARGEVPVVMLNSNQLKDQVGAMLSRRVAEADEATGGGMIRFPSWLEDFIYQQLTNEIRTARGWENPAKRRNESFDLVYYAIGLALRPNDTATNAPLAVIRFDRIDWADPPSWAADWDDNDLVFGATEARRFSVQTRAKVDFEKLGKDLA